MDEHNMTQGLIPLRHSSLPGLVKLPRRFEKAAVGDPRTAKLRKVSICAASRGETISDRLDDLKMAVVWVKQELILLRQNDILLKRQFLDIHNSIQSLQPQKTVSSLFESSHQTSSSITMNGDIKDHNSSAGSSSFAPYQPLPFATITKKSTAVMTNNDSDYKMETFLVRPSASVSLLNSKNEDGEDSGDDTFFEDEYHRPRTSSMKTSRDLAALARRRGSKELI